MSLNSELNPLNAGRFFQVDRTEIVQSTYHFVSRLLGHLKWQTLKLHSWHRLENRL